MSKRELEKYVFTSRYAGYKDNLNRRETWYESVNRSRNMMLEKYKDKDINDIINSAYDGVKRKEVLGSQRCLQFGGKPIFKHNARMYNCLGAETEFITKEGVKSFKDFNDGDIVEVLTHKGNWKNAIVKNYGKQKINKITFVKNNNKSIVRATANHRWILNNDNVTDQLDIGDRLYKAPNILEGFDYDNAPLDEKLYWCYGFVYGDGTVNGGHSLVRLCGDDSKLAYRFTNMGFKTSSSLSIDGDIIVYTGKYQKTTPDPKHDDPRLIKAFVRGYLDADGTKSKNNYGSKFIGIQSSESDHINFISKCFPIAGVYITSEKDLTGQKTNYGTRPYTIFFKTSDNMGSKYNSGFKVLSIEEDGWDDVWCLEVEDDKSFILPNGIVTGNCISSYADRSRFFQECMYLLLCGCGTGFSVQKHHVAKLPKLIKQKAGTKKFVIPDTIEGWSDAVGILVSSYFQDNVPFPEYIGKTVKFDFSLIRKAGANLSSGAGKAPGPEPLMKCLKKIKAILDDCVKQGLNKLRPIHVYDIVMHFADAVVSGGVRRSATICVFSPDDLEMAEAKTGNWLQENPQRGRSNNSALLIRDKTTKEEFVSLMDVVKNYGEPGFVWADSPEHLVNPCVEISFWCYLVEDEDKWQKYLDKNGPYEAIACDPAEIGLRSGWQACNLSTINCAKIDSLKDFLLACEYAAVIGTLQAGFDSFPYLGEVSEKIIRREALLGVSMTGIMEKPDICLDPDNQREGAKVVRETNRAVAKAIGINQAARTTCIKPEGTSSCVLGTSSGIHAHHAKRYIRRVQANILDEVYQYFKSINPIACQESVWSANNTDDVISFCIEVPDGSKTKNMVGALDLLKIVKSTQQNWVIPGRNAKQCTMPWLNNNVSNTISVKEEEWEDVTNFIYDNRKYFCGIALLPFSGDKDYDQSPFTAVHLPSEMVSMYGDASMFVSGLIDKALELYEDNLWKACDALLIEELKPKGNSKKEWYDRCYKYAERYMNGEIKKLTYCMKDVYTWKLWLDLNRNYKKVDYTLLVEKENNVVPESEVACAGGSCEI